MLPDQSKGWHTLGFLPILPHGVAMEQMERANKKLVQFFSVSHLVHASVARDL